MCGKELRVEDFSNPALQNYKISINKTKMTKEKIIKFAKSNIFDNVEYIGKWKGTIYGNRDSMMMSLALSAFLSLSSSMAF